MYNYLLGLLGLVGVAFTSISEAEVNRIVSVGGSISEWVIALDGENKLVGVDTTSLYPKQLTQLPKVGYQRQLSAEGVASLKPEVLLGTNEMGPPNVLEQIKTLGIKVEVLSNKADLETVRHNLLVIGDLLGKGPQSKILYDNYQAELAKYTSQVAQVQNKQAKPNVLLAIGFSGNLLAAGQETTGDWLINKAGGNNVVTFNSYKVLANEALVALNPDIILLANTGGVTDKELVANLIKTNPSLQLTKAVQQNKVIMLDASLLVAGLGPRIPSEVNRLMNIFYNLPTSVDSNH